MITFGLKALQKGSWPKRYMGQIEAWDRAEDMLRQSLDEFAASANGVSWTLNASDGAFYGPKVDITIVGCPNRDWQCTTIQLDFLQPQNFHLEYVTAESTALLDHRHGEVIIHIEVSENIGPECT
ncbi:hypothetical protein DL770_004418 [Monosporascus sp. CRB-9-2]|nr:hypothetical protein DL770_004418 [Monosporascus sp. CRB-9-2]